MYVGGVIRIAIDLLFHTVSMNPFIRAFSRLTGQENFRGQANLLSSYNHKYERIPSIFSWFLRLLKPKEIILIAFSLIIRYLFHMSHGLPLQG